MSGHEEGVEETGVVAAPKRHRRPRADGIGRERRWWYAVLSVAWVGGAFFLDAGIVRAVLSVLHGLGVNFASIDQDVLTTALAVLVYVILLGLTLGLPRLFKLWSGRISYRRLLGLTRLLQWRDILSAAVGFIVYLALGIGLVLLVSALIPGFNPSQTQDTGYTKYLTPNDAVMVFVSLVVIAPIAEEIVFRGYLFGTLRRSVPVWVAALLTSGLFAVIHGQWNVGLDVFMMSLVSCYLRYRTGSLWASILLHMAKNGLAFYTLYVATSSIL